VGIERPIGGQTRLIQQQASLSKLEDRFELPDFRQRS
jgi:hypothetical protein